MPIALQLEGVNWEVLEAHGPDGQPLKVLIFSDPLSNIRVTIPVSEPVAKKISSELSGTAIEVASTIPPIQVAR